MVILDELAPWDWETVRAILGAGKGDALRSEAASAGPRAVILTRDRHGRLTENGEPMSKQSKQATSPPSDAPRTYMVRIQVFDPADVFDPDETADLPLAETGFEFMAPVAGSAVEAVDLCTDTLARRGVFGRHPRPRGIARRLPSRSE